MSLNYQQILTLIILPSQQKQKILLHTQIKRKSRLLTNPQKSRSIKSNRKLIVGMLRSSRNQNGWNSINRGWFSNKTKLSVNLNLVEFPNLKNNLIVNKKNNLGNKSKKKGIFRWKKPKRNLQLVITVSLNIAGKRNKFRS